MKEKIEILRLLDMVKERYPEIENFKTSASSLPAEKIPYDRHIVDMHQGIIDQLDLISNDVAQEFNQLRLVLQLSPADVKRVILASFLNNRFDRMAGIAVETVKRFRNYCGNPAILHSPTLPLQNNNLGVFVSVKSAEERNVSDTYLLEYNTESYHLASLLTGLIVGTCQIGTDKLDLDLSRVEDSTLLVSFRRAIREMINGVPPEASEEPGAPTTLIYGILLSCVLDFIIAHEMSHILHGDLATSNGGEVAEDVITKFIYNVKGKDLLADHMQEYLADLRSIDFLIQSQDSANHQFKPLVIQLYLPLSSYINSRGRSDSISIESETHPSVNDRLSLIRVFLFDRFINYQDHVPLQEWERCMKFSKPLVQTIIAVN